MSSRTQKILRAALAQKFEKKCDVVLIPPLESDIENSSSDESEDEILNEGSDIESDAPSIDSEVQEILEGLSDSSDDDCDPEPMIIEMTPMKSAQKMDEKMEISDSESDAPSINPGMREIMDALSDSDNEEVLKNTCVEIQKESYLTPSKKIESFQSRLEKYMKENSPTPPAQSLKSTDIHKQDPQPGCSKTIDESINSVPEKLQRSCLKNTRKLRLKRLGNATFPLLRLRNGKNLQKTSIFKKAQKFESKKMVTRSSKIKNIDQVTKKSKTLLKIEKVQKNVTKTRKLLKKIKDTCKVPKNVKNVSKKNEKTVTIRCKDSKKKIPVKIKKVKCAKKLQMKLNWSREEFLHEIEIPEKQPDIIEEDLDPIEFFNLFFDQSCFELLVEQTNLYSTQKTTKCINTNVQEIKDFLGIEILMGIINLPAYRDYWSEKFRVPKIADVMPLKRYEVLRNNLHFVDNEKSNAYENDRFFKVRPILEIVRKNCLKISHENKFSVDEMMIPYKGVKAGSRRQYIKNKPKKWGFKFFVRAGVSGIVYDFLPYAGETTFNGFHFTEWEEKYFGVGQRVVTTLCKTIPEPQMCAVFFDNWFTSVELVYYLREEYGILATGTAMENRLRKCELIKDKLLKKRARGSFDYRTDNKKKLNVVKWFDNKCVTLVSSNIDLRPVQEVQRYSKTEKKRIGVQCPKIVKVYNQNMGGVDLADMLVSLYRTGMKSHRWYLAIFSQILDICVNNAWLLYRRKSGNQMKNMTKLKEFRYEIADSLIRAGKVKIGRPSTSSQNPRKPKLVAKNAKIPHPSNSVRLDKIDHLPDTMEIGRCRFCSKSRTTFYCTKCEVRLCIAKNRNCYSAYHNVKKL